MTLVNVNTANSIRTLTFNRPDALNAFTPDLLHELVDAIHEADKDENIRVLVLTGAGRAFSAGVDLKVLQGIKPEEGRVGNVFDDIAASAASTLRSSRLPVIARVHGACFTGALEMALHCDFVYTTDDTKFGDTHTKWGLRPTWGMSQHLARAIGVRRARELSFTARTFYGQDAARWGVANESAPDLAALDALVDKRANEIAVASPGAVSAYKTLYRIHEENLPLEDALDREVTTEFSEITDTVERLKGFG